MILGSPCCPLARDLYEGDAGFGDNNWWLGMKFRFADVVRTGLFLLFAGILTACSGDKKEELQYVERPVESIYNQAVDELAKKRYLKSALLFDEVERQHPYSVWARRSMLMSAYAYYEINKYDDATNAAERFIALHPGNADVAYAYYLIAISHYEQITDVGRDQKRTEEAYKALQDVVRRFPTSEYSRDARLKLDMTRDHLAGKEMTVGRYYLKRHNYIAAINRFRTVIEKYQTTSHAAEALHRLTEAYLAMGIVNEAQTAAAVLGHNYPGSDWYNDSYVLLTKADLEPVENKKSWISRAWNTVKFF